MYEIPKIAVSVEILLATEELLSGNMFVTEDLLSAAGNPLLEDFLNDESDQFFPFQAEAGAYRLINKSQVMSIRTEQTDEEAREQTPIKPRNLVVHFPNNRTVFGLVYPTLAEESRVSDFINQDDDYLVIYQSGQKIVVNKHRIVYVNAN